MTERFCSMICSVSWIVEKVYNIPPKIAGFVTPVIFSIIVQYSPLTKKRGTGNEERVQYYDKKDVGKRIKQVRKSKGMTQYKLAECLDYTNGRQLQRIENGETACPVDKLMEIAQILDTSTDFLLFGQKRDGKDSGSQYFEGKSERQKQYLERILQAAADNLMLLE